MPSALWIVRHGESAGNVARDRAQAAGADRIEIDAARDMDVPLSALGERQARALGRWIADLAANERPTAVLTSPYLRAQRTCEQIVRTAGLPAPYVDERLRERELGVLDRVTRRGLARLFPEQAALRAALGKFYFRPPAGESWCDVILRLRSVLETLQRTHAGDRVLLVCHSAVVLCFRYVLESLTEQEILAIDAQHEVANCSLTMYEGAPLALRQFNFVAPLEEEGAPVTAEPSAATK